MISWAIAERLGRGSQFLRAHQAERVVALRTGVGAALAARRRHDDDAQPFVGEARQCAAARERLVVGMSENGEDGAPFQIARNHRVCRRRAAASAIVR